MKLKRLTALLAVMVFLAAFRPVPLQEGRFSVQVTGAVERDFSGGEVFYETTPVGRQIRLQKAGPGDDLLALILILPPQERPGEYQLTTLGEATASYFEDVGGVSRSFTENVSGRLSILESGSQFSGQLEMTAQEGEQSVSITGTFDQIPFADQQQAPPAGSPRYFQNAVAVSLGFLFLFLLALNFLFQFYIGSRVYFGNIFAQSMNGTRTYRLGWRDARLYPAMIMWSILLVLMVALIIVVFVVL